MVKLNTDILLKPRRWGACRRVLIYGIRMGARVAYNLSQVYGEDLWNSSSQSLKCTKQLNNEIDSNSSCLKYSCSEMKQSTLALSTKSA